MSRREDIHYHWTFQAFHGTELPSPEHPKYVVEVTVVGYASEAEAVVAARSIITRDGFLLVRVFECPRCGFEEAAAETQRELVNVVKQSLE
jgi:hypothetical protein